MFKRVQKRQRKQEKEEKLGLTSEMKEVLGMHDTDSDESETSSESGSDDEGEEVDGAIQRLVGEDDESEGGDEGEEQDESEDENEDSLPEFPPLTITEAMRDPLYPISSDGTLKVCAVCPAKKLRTEKMEEEHRNSKAHYRRFARFVEFAGAADPETSMEDFWRALDEENKQKDPTAKKDGPLSKRAEKRKLKQQVVKEKRKKTKELKAKGMARKAAEKAKKIAAATSENDEVPTTEVPAAPAKRKSSDVEKTPPKKRRKVADGGKDAKKAPKAQALRVVVGVEPDEPPASSSKSSPEAKQGLKKPKPKQRPKERLEKVNVSPPKPKKKRPKATT